MFKYMIFVPTYYAEASLISVIERIPKCILDEVAEILIQDDASSDNTFMIAQEIAKTSTKVTAVKNIQNLGYGGTQKKAYSYAIEKGYEAVVMVHGDGQLPPEYLPDVLTPLRNKQADVVLGSRILGDPIGGGMPVYKFLGNRFLTLLMNHALKQDLSDYHTGYVAITTRALTTIDFASCGKGHEISAELLIRSIRAGLVVKEVPVPTCYGKASRSITLLTSVKYGVSTIKLLRMENK